MLISHKTVLGRVISRKFFEFRVISNFSQKLQSTKMLNSYISKTVLDRADYIDFGCQNSIRLEAEHLLNTLALTVISFSGRFVFAVQKHSFFLQAIL